MISWGAPQDGIHLLIIIPAMNLPKGTPTRPTLSRPCSSSAGTATSREAVLASLRGSVYAKGKSDNPNPQPDKIGAICDVLVVLTRRGGHFEQIARRHGTQTQRDNNRPWRNRLTDLLRSRQARQPDAERHHQPVRRLLPRRGRRRLLHGEPALQLGRRQAAGVEHIPRRSVHQPLAGLRRLRRPRDPQAALCRRHLPARRHLPGDRVRRLLLAVWLLR